MLEPLDPVTYHRDVLPAHLAGERGAAAARDLSGVAPLTLVVDGRPYTYRAVEAGRLEAVAGSHGQTCRYALDGDVTGLPVVGVDTAPGDVTLHYADAMHASPPPTGAGGRRVLYVTWYNPAILDFVGVGDARNDLVRDRQAAAADLAG